MTSEFRALGPTEVPAAVELLAQAFAADPSLTYFLAADPFADPRVWAHQIRAFLNLVVRSAVTAGDGVWGLFDRQDLTAVAVTEDRRPGGCRTLRRTWSEVTTLATVGRGVPWAALQRVEGYRRSVRRAHRGGLDFYLVMVGVDPGRQGQGQGRKLFSTLVAQFPGVWGLDTENAANLPLYRRWGLVQNGVLRLDNLDVFLLSWEAKKEAL